MPGLSFTCGVLGDVRYSPGTYAPLHFYEQSLTLLFLLCFLSLIYARKGDKECIIIPGRHGDEKVTKEFITMPARFSTEEGITNDFVLFLFNLPLFLHLCLCQRQMH